MVGPDAAELVAVGAATLTGLFLRLFDLGARALSSVEVYTWDFASHPISFILGPLSRIETNPPLYYLLANLVMRLGDSEFLLRLPSAIAGTIAIPLVYVLGRVGGAPRSGVIGAGLLSLSAIAIDYSRQARTYALLQDACLFSAIGAVMIVARWTAGAREPRPSPRPSYRSPSNRTTAGWILLSVAGVTGFYLHYSFLFLLVALECALGLAVVLAWLSGRLRIDRRILVPWGASGLVILLGASWGIVLAHELAHSDNLAWIVRPGLGEAMRLWLHVDGYSSFFRLQPLPNVILVALALLGVAVGWRRSAAVFVCGMLFLFFPALLFLVSFDRPVFIERTLVAPSFAVGLLAGQGMLFLVAKVTVLARRRLRRVSLARWDRQRVGAVIAGAALMGLFAPAVVSAAHAVRGGRNWEPYDEVAAYLASVMRPGDAAAGTDGVIYYRRQTGAQFPYYKLVEGDSAEALVTYGSPAVTDRQVPKLADTGHAVYLVLREVTELVLDGKLYASDADYVRDKLGIDTPPVQLFGTLSVYKLKGRCAAPAPCARVSR